MNMTKWILQVKNYFKNLKKKVREAVRKQYEEKKNQKDEL
jgi:hypothetical protein